MIMSEFLERVNRWPAMHFTAIECEKRDAGYEIYVLDKSHQTVSRLLIYRTPDKQHASAMSAHFRIWLEKDNRKRTPVQLKKTGKSILDKSSAALARVRGRTPQQNAAVRTV
jgi:hypothetical protein